VHPPAPGVAPTGVPAASLPQAQAQAQAQGQGQGQVPLSPEPRLGPAADGAAPRALGALGPGGGGGGTVCERVCEGVPVVGRGENGKGGVHRWLIRIWLRAGSVHQGYTWGITCQSLSSRSAGAGAEWWGRLEGNSIDSNRAAARGAARAAARGSRAATRGHQGSLLMQMQGLPSPSGPGPCLRITSSHSCGLRCADSLTLCLAWSPRGRRSPSGATRASGKGRISGFRFKVYGLGFRVEGLGFEVQG